jgi:hypothetical protein
MLIGCSTFAQNALNYIQVNNYNSPSYNIVKIDDFLKLLNDNKIQTVFYTDRQFIIQAQNIAYTINSIGYKDLVDYKDGNDKEFKDGNTYYYALKTGLSTQFDVETFNSYPFFSITDYEDAKRLGIFNESSSIKGYSGLISADDLNRNIKYANLTVYISFYLFYNKNIDVLKSNGLTDEQIASLNFNNQSGWGSTRVEDGSGLLDNIDIDFLLQKSNNCIKKMNNYNYFLINISSENKAAIYYLHKLTPQNTTETILSSLGFKSLDELIDADQKGITNSKDYYLVYNYGITKEQLEEWRIFINELEKIKQNYLSSYENKNRYYRDYQYGRSTPTMDSKYAFIIYYMLKQPKGIPITVDVFNNYLENERKNSPMVGKFLMNNYFNTHYIDTSVLNGLFNEVQSLSRTFQYNNGSFYLK